MKKILGVLFIYFFLIQNKNTIKASKNNQTNCGFVRSLQDQNDFKFLATLPNGHLAAGSVSGGITIWDTENAIQLLYINSLEVFCLIVLPDGNLTSGSIGEFDVFNTTDGSLLNYIYPEPKFSAFAFALLENGYLAAGSLGLMASIEIWNINNSTLVNTINTGYPIGVGSLAYIKSDLLASSDAYQNTIEIWNAINRKLERTLVGHTDYVNCLQTLKNGSLVSGSNDMTIKIWDPKSGDLLNTLTGHTNFVESLTEFVELGYLASGGQDAIKVWDLSNGKMVATFENSQANKIVVLPNGFLASATDSIDVKIWNVKDCVSD